MAETREPSTPRDEDQGIPAGSQRDLGSKPQRQAAETTAKEKAPPTAAVPRGSNTPDSLEQPHDLGDFAAETGSHMHPASLTPPEQDLEMTEGDEPAVP